MSGRLASSAAGFMRRMHNDAVADLPDYYLSRPPMPGGAVLDDFERVVAEQIKPIGHRVIDYRLPVPKWQFLCWLTDTKPILLHGSSAGDIAEFEPRRPGDTSEFGGQQAVFGASDGIWALFFAVVERTVAGRLINACFSMDGQPESRYYFSIDADALNDPRVFTSGWVYVLPREGFQRQPDDDFRGRLILSQQWASVQPVRPLAALRVEAVDFPFLEMVNGHDEAAVTARAAADPGGFPWRS
jgi:hypothetical protein